MQAKQLLNLLKKAGTYWLPTLLPQFPLGHWEQRSQGSISLQLPGLEDLSDFPVEYEMEGPAYFV